MADSFGDWLAANGTSAGPTWGEHVDRHRRDVGFSMHYRTIRSAERTAAKVRAHGQHGKLGAGGVVGSTAGSYTRRVSRSAESQFVSAEEARRVRLAIAGVFV